MREFASISALIGLLVSGYAPVRVAVCHQKIQATVCHRAAPVHHCDMPMDDDEAASPNDSQSSMGAAAATCPMDCCRTACSPVTTILPAQIHVASLRVLAAKDDFGIIIVKANSPRSPSERGPPSI